jgi:hypothetical protein
LRHTTVTWVERGFGEAVARAYAGHAEKAGSEAGTTSIYTKATLGEVAAALSALTGERHPLAETVDAIFADSIAESVAAGLTADTAKATALGTTTWRASRSAAAGGHACVELTGFELVTP